MFKRMHGGAADNRAFPGSSYLLHQIFIQFGVTMRHRDREKTSLEIWVHRMSGANVKKWAAHLVVELLG